MRSQTPNVNDVVRRGDGPAIDYMFAVKQEIHDGDVAELTDVQVSHACTGAWVLQLLFQPVSRRYRVHFGSRADCEILAYHPKCCRPIALAQRIEQFAFKCQIG